MLSDDPLLSIINIKYGVTFQTMNQWWACKIFMNLDHAQNSWFMKEIFQMWVSDCCLMPNEQYFSNMKAGSTCSCIRWENNDVRFVPDQQTQSYFYSASSLKQQSHVTLLGHIIPILRQPVFALSPKCCMLNGEATNINL